MVGMDLSHNFFFANTSVHSMNGQFLALIYGYLPTTFNGLSQNGQLFSGKFASKRKL